jgi:hypothetical protein
VGRSGLIRAFLGCPSGGKLLRSRVWRLGWPYTRPRSRVDNGLESPRGSRLVGGQDNCPGSRPCDSKLRQRCGECLDGCGGGGARHRRVSAGMNMTPTATTGQVVTVRSVTARAGGQRRGGLSGNGTREAGSRSLAGRTWTPELSRSFMSKYGDLCARRSRVAIK